MYSFLVSFPRHIWIVLIVTTCLATGGCSSWPPIIKTAPIGERVEGKVLIIGCVIVEPSRYQYKPMRVVLGYQPPDTEEEKLQQVWAETDSIGYFALANMPAGRYTISGVRQDGREASIVFTYHRTSETWSRNTHDFYFPWSMKPKTWPVMEEGGIYNFGYLILTYEVRRTTPAHIVKAYNYQSLEGQSFLSGTEYCRPLLPQHFIERYPDSEWTPYLRRLLKPIEE